MRDQTLFQYCQKLVLLSNDLNRVLLAKRVGEQDYDGVYSFIGGKLETTDESLLAGLRREKNEEIGESARVSVLPNETYNLLFRKKDGNAMIITHTPAKYIEGNIVLSDEYSEYQWVEFDQLEAFEPKIANIPELSLWAQSILQSTDKDFVDL